MSEAIPLADSFAPLPAGSRSRKGGCTANLTEVQREKRRRMQSMEAQRRRRAKLSGMGGKVVSILLTEAEARLVAELTDVHCPSAASSRDAVALRAGHCRRALIVGLTMLANAGAPRGSKKRGNAAAAAIKGSFADMSANSGEGSAL